MKLKFLWGNWEESFSAGSQKTPQVAVRTFFFFAIPQNGHKNGIIRLPAAPVGVF